MHRDRVGVRLLFVNGVNISVHENCLGGLRAGSDAAHEQQDSSGASHQSDSSVILAEKARSWSATSRHGGQVSAAAAGIWFLNSGLAYHIDCERPPPLPRTVEDFFCQAVACL